MLKKILSVILTLIIGLSSLSVCACAATKKSIKLSKSSTYMYEGKTTTLNIAVTGYKKYTVQYSSSDKSVATVKAGKKSCTVTAKKAGTAVITAKIKGTKYKSTCKITVKEDKEKKTSAPKTVTMEGKTYSLSFEDNFDGEKLDTAKWSRCPEWKRQDMNCYWSDNMSYLDGSGCLVLEANYDKSKDRFTMGAVRSKNKFEQAYGYFEIRCTVNTIPGYWTAFWLMGETVGPDTDGKGGTEIDIMESAYFKTNEVQNTLHWGGYAEKHRSVGKKSKANIYDGEFHTFSLLWTEKEYIFYTDGKETWRTDAKEAKGVCEVPLYMKITAETGSWTGGPDKSKLPDKMLIDYVRVYK